MRIRADHDIAGENEPLFGKQRVLDTHLSNIVKMGNVVLVAKIAAHFTLRCGFDVFIRREMVHNHRNLVFIVNGVHAELFKFTDRDGGRDVVAEHPIECHEHELPRFHLFKPRLCRENFLRHCH